MNEVFDLLATELALWVLDHKDSVSNGADHVLGLVSPEIHDFLQGLEFVGLVEV